MIILDYKDKRPLYEQIVDKFAELILKGGLAAGDKLPSVRSLAMELSINPNTIQRAYGELEQKGFIYSVKGRGNYVSENSDLLNEKRNEMKAILKNVLMEAKSIGMERQEILNLLDEIYEGGKRND